MSPTNIAASVRARLLNVAKAQGADSDLILTQFGLERLLYRLSVSPYAERFLLKGALLFNLWYDLPRRPTRDADLLGFGSSEISDLIRVFRDICATECDDGIRFQRDTVSAEPIRKDAAYPGVRVKLRGTLDGARCPIQVDIGFGDIVVPKPETVAYPVLLDNLPAPSIRAYPRYSVIAEKFHALVVLGLGNSRAKDYFDLWTIAMHSELDGDVLSRAVSATFERRETPLPIEIPMGLSDTFIADTLKQSQWKAFLGKNKLSAPDLADVIGTLRTFLLPVVGAVVKGTAFASRWIPGKQWRSNQ